MTAVTVRPALQRPRDVVLGGVSVALSRHLGIPVVLVRGVFVVATVIGIPLAVYATWMLGNAALASIGIACGLLYLWLWALVPREQGTPDAERSRAVPVAAVLLGIAAAIGLLVPLTWGLPTPLP